MTGAAFAGFAQHRQVQAMLDAAMARLFDDAAKPVPYDATGWQLLQRALIDTMHKVKIPPTWSLTIRTDWLTEEMKARRMAPVVQLRIKYQELA